jgi:hypothetical protein
MLPLPVCSSELSATSVAVCDDLLLRRRWASTAARHSGARQTNTSPASAMEKVSAHLENLRHSLVCHPTTHPIAASHRRLKTLDPNDHFVVSSSETPLQPSDQAHAAALHALRAARRRLRASLPLNGWQAPGLAVS